MATNKEATNIVTLNRGMIDYAYEQEMATKRNARAAFAEFEAGFTSRVLIWAIGGMTIETLNGKTIYAGKLATSTLYLGTKKGYSSRGAIKPIAFGYDPATKEVFALSSETSERRSYLAAHVARLMEKWLAGNERIANAATIESLKKVRGYNMARLPIFEDFFKAYRGSVASTTDMTNVPDAVLASLPDLD